MPKTHPDDKTLEKFSRGKLTRRENLKVSWHLYNCATCRQQVEGEGEAGGKLLDTLFAGMEPQDLAHSPTYDRAFSYSQGTLEVRGEARDRDRNRAPKLFAELMRHPVSRQRALIERTWRFKNYVFAEYLLEQSYLQLADDPARAEDLANLALVVAEKLANSHYGPALMNDLKARSLAFLGNAQRVSGELRDADSTLREAEQARVDGSGDPLLKARLLSFTGSLRGEQRRFDEAEESFQKAMEIYREAGESHWVGHTLLALAKVYKESGRPEKGAATYEEALALVDTEREPRLAFVSRMGTVTCLENAGQYEKAVEALPQLKRLAADLGNRLDQLRVRWLEGQLHYHLEQLEKAEATLSEVRATFSDSGMGFDAALSSLDLAQVYLRQGRTAEVKQLAEEMLPLFHSRDVHREAAAALIVFQKAAEKEKASLQVVQDITSYLRQARNHPELRYKRGK